MQATTRPNTRLSFPAGPRAAPAQAAPETHRSGKGGSSIHPRRPVEGSPGLPPWCRRKGFGRRRSVLMRLIDSCGWIEFFTNGPSADEYASEPGAPERIVVPTVVLRESVQVPAAHCRRGNGLRCAGRMTTCHRGPRCGYRVGGPTSPRHKPAMADAIVTLATASREGAELVTSDADLKGLPSVRFIPKK